MDHKCQKCLQYGLYLFLERVFVQNNRIDFLLQSLNTKLSTLPDSISIKCQSIAIYSRRTLFFLISWIMLSTSELECWLTENGKSANRIEVSWYSVVLLENYKFEFFYQGLNLRWSIFRCFLIGTICDCVSSIGILKVRKCKKGSFDINSRRSSHSYFSKATGLNSSDNISVETFLSITCCLKVIWCVLDQFFSPLWQNVSLSDWTSCWRNVFYLFEAVNVFSEAKLDSVGFCIEWNIQNKMTQQDDDIRVCSYSPKNNLRSHLNSLKDLPKTGNETQRNESERKRWQGGFHGTSTIC